MDTTRRAALLKRGLALALIPAVIFVPVVAFFSVCPPSFGLMGARIALILFLASDIWAVRKLIPTFNTTNNGKVDRLNLLAWTGCTIAILTVIVSSVLLSGYPWTR